MQRLPQSESLAAVTKALELDVLDASALGSLMPLKPGAMPGAMPKGYSMGSTSVANEAAIAAQLTWLARVEAALSAGEKSQQPVAERPDAGTLHATHAPESPAPDRSPSTRREQSDESCTPDHRKAQGSPLPRLRGFWSMMLPAGMGEQLAQWAATGIPSSDKFSHDPGLHMPASPTYEATTPSSSKSVLQVPALSSSPKSLRRLFGGLDGGMINVRRIRRSRANSTITWL